VDNKELQKRESSQGLLFYAIEYIEYGMGMRLRMYCSNGHAFIIFVSVQLEWGGGGGSFGEWYVIQRN
jgi:hypothetical protein